MRAQSGEVAQRVAVLGEAGGVVPRWQDVPAAARINAASVWRLRCWGQMYSLPVLVLSYPWLDRHHPDKHGATLRRILPILRACRQQAQRFRINFQKGLAVQFGKRDMFISLFEKFADVLCDCICSSSAH